MQITSKELILAPLRGITNHHFRSLFQKHFGGFDQAMAPFIPTVQATKFNENLFRDIFPSRNLSLPLIPQLIGNNPLDFIRMSRHIHETYGYREINWNLGCPVGTVTRKKKGAGLLLYPEMIFSFLDKVSEGFPCDLSVKIRLGFDRPDQLYRMMERLNDYPIKTLTVHARTALQMYEGRVDTKNFGWVLEKARMPVCYNGDITSLSSFESLSSLFPDSAGWMIGRGAVSNPLLGRQIKGESISDPIKKIYLFHEELFDIYKAHYYGPAPLLGAMKEIWNHLHLFFKEGKKILKAVRKSKTPQQYQNTVESFFNGNDSQANKPF